LPVPRLTGNSMCRWVPSRGVDVPLRPQDPGRSFRDALGGKACCLAGPGTLAAPAAAEERGAHPHSRPVERLHHPSEDGRRAFLTRASAKAPGSTNCHPGGGEQPVSPAVYRIPGSQLPSRRGGRARRGISEYFPQSRALNITSAVAALARGQASAGRGSCRRTGHRSRLYLGDHYRNGVTQSS
jgi:hypothetical protein